MTTAPAGHVRPLTSLRFIAAFWVLCHHALPQERAGAFGAEFASTGWLGVSLFFVLSGFLLTVRYAPDGALVVPTSRFWLERVARLAPTYLLALAFALPLFLRDARVQELGSALTARVAVTVLTLQQAWRPETACVWNCPAWSLSVETWFYLAFPLIVAVLGRWLLAAPARGAVLLASAMLASAAIFPALEQRSVDWTLPVFSLSPLSRWPEFVAGIGLAALASRWRPTNGTAGWVTLAAGVVWVASAVWNREALESAGGHLLPVALPGFVLVILGAWGLRGVAAGVLASPLLVLLGEASYALYLLHAPLHSYVLAVTNRVAGRGFDTSWAVFALYLPLALGLSVAVYHWVERPARTRLRAAFGLTRAGAEGARA